MTRAYVDTRITDLAAAERAAEVAAAHWRLDAPVLMRHGMNAIYRSGDCVLRVATPSAPAQVSIELAEVLRRHDIAVPPARHTDVVEHAGMSVTAWPHLEASGEPIDWTAVGAMIRRVHRLDAEQLPPGLPVPSPTSFPWWDFDAMLAAVGDSLDADARAGIGAALDRHAGWDHFDEVVVCHGDVHPGNVVMTADGPMLIDWDLLCAAPFGWDHAPLMTWTERWGGEVGVYEAFADGYGISGRGNPSAEAFAELRLVAATLMRLKAGSANPAAMPEAQRRLAHWRGDPDAPIWRAQ
jgi:Phosphotransferase enzyme family